MENIERYRHLNSYLKNKFGERTLKYVLMEILLALIATEKLGLLDVYFAVKEVLENIFCVIILKIM